MKDPFYKDDKVLIFLHEIEQQLILEQKDKGTKITGAYSYKKHQPRNNKGQYHIHVYKKDNQIFSMNADGSGHDGYSGTRIPNDVYYILKQQLKGFKFPPDQIIENYIYMESEKNIFLRKVKVLPHSHITGITYNIEKTFEGYFHSFGNHVFLTGGNGGYKEMIIAIIEDEEGNIHKIIPDKIKFI
ncbi:hypothetical protein [Flavobacterium sp.]|uniref:hypothetical protein n=1 Tax=Flavobacterium sp. TaxID=239 RepID=UPI003D09FC14